MNEHHPHRRWFQFSLRALFVLLTLAGLLLGRVAYLLHRAAYHDREAEVCRRGLLEIEGYKPADLENEVASWSGAGTRIHRGDFFMRPRWGEFVWHRLLADEYRHAAWRPWTLVDETVPPDEN